MIKIGFISPYERACEMMREMAAERGVEALCEVAVLEHAIPVAERFRKEGAAAVISRVPTSTGLVERFGSFIVEFGISNYAFLAALEKARQYDRLVVFVDVIGGGYALDNELLGRALGIQIVRIEMSGYEDGERCVRIAQEMNARAIVSTAACLRRIALPLGIRVIMIEIERESLGNALETAIAIGRATAETEKFKLYMDNEQDGILTLDGEERIQIFNRAMCRLTGLDRSLVLGKTLKEAGRQHGILQGIAEEKHLFDWEGTFYYAASFPISSEGGGRGRAIKIFPADNHRAREDFGSRRVTGTSFRAQHCFEDLLGTSAAIRRAVSTAKRYARTNSTILITGESGSGKELFAQSIHNASPYDGPFVAINCAALPENLLESELYGYEEGAFSGARRGGKLGLFELSNGGTLFLDEIGEIPLSAQARLLRSIQERQIIRIGGNRVINVTNRIICATNRDLEEAVRRNTFREDLYYRINILNVTLPPLRQRPEDIPILARHFAKGVCSETGRAIRFPAHLLNRLAEYSWPGNARQLAAFVERLLVTCEEDEVTGDLFEWAFDSLCGRSETPEEPQHPEQPDEHTMEIRIASLEDMEGQIIRQIYSREAGSTKACSALLGISRTTLWRRLKAEGIAPADSGT